MFWGSLDKHYYDALMEIFINKEISFFFSQRLSVITLIHTKDSKSLLKNYRPLSLINTDYKIIAFVFARRLQSIIDKLIGHEQSSYIKGRFIGENARLILYIYEYCKNMNQEVYLCFFRLRKSF